MIIINTILIITLLLIAGAILYELYRTKEESKLRRIMMWYFGTEMLLLGGLLFLEANYGERVLMATQYIVFTALLPKTIVKLFFYNYIHHG